LNFNQPLLKKLALGLAIILLCLMLGRFFTHAYARAITNSNSGNGDQGAFLQLGLDMREHGILTDGTRNPLYAAFLAATAHRGWSYFTNAKLMSITFGLLTVIAVFILGWRYFNPFTGLVAAYLVSINVEFTVHSATALTESLLVLLMVLAWFAMIHALKHKEQWLVWVLAGVLVALAYLAKGSGQLLGYAFLISAFLIYRFNLFRGRSLYLFLIAYFMTVSPLWIYNTIHYGSPNFNYAISHQMWMDSWSEWHPDDTDNLPTAFSYLQTHTVAELFEREWNGLQAERNILVKTLYPTRSLQVDNFLLSPISWYALALLVLLPVIFWRSSYRFIKEHQGAVYLTAFTVAIFFGLFAWYTPIIPGTRFVLALMPLIFIFGAYIFSLILSDVTQRGRWGQLLVVATILVIIFMQTRWWIRTLREPLEVLLTSNLYDHDREFGQDAATPLAWLADGYPGATVVWGPSGHSLPIWAFSDRLNFTNYPPNVTEIPQLTADFADRGVDFVIVDNDMVARHKKLLRDQFPANGYTVELTAIPEHWALAYAYRAMPCDWCVFRLTQNRPPQNLTDYQLGDAITLTGYDLAATTLAPGDTVRLTLHWQAQAPPEDELTVFTQLLGPDWQLHGQQDNQPVNNLWPTSRWQTGDYIADRYDIAISSQAPAGVYQILVGMYDPATGERVPIDLNSEPVADNAIFLTPIQIKGHSTAP
jgi:hypothetical protein